MLLIPIQFLINSLNFSIILAASWNRGKSPGVAGALSLTPDGVSDPAAASGTPAQRSDPARSEAGRGGSEKGGGSGQFNPLIFLYLTFHFSMIVNSFN